MNGRLETMRHVLDGPVPLRAVQSGNGWNDLELIFAHFSESRLGISFNAKAKNQRSLRPQRTALLDDLRLQIGPVADFDVVAEFRSDFLLLSHGRASTAGKSPWHGQLEHGRAPTLTMAAHAPGMGR